MKQLVFCIDVKTSITNPTKVLVTHVYDKGHPAATRHRNDGPSIATWLVANNQLCQNLHHKISHTADSSTTGKNKWMPRACPECFIMMKACRFLAESPQYIFRAQSKFPRNAGPGWAACGIFLTVVMILSNSIFSHIPGPYLDSLAHNQEPDVQKLIKASHQSFAAKCRCTDMYCLIVGNPNTIVVI